MSKYDVIVIGGGLLGCFAARSLSRYDLRIALLEKREDICTGISRANTAIVYSGCDTKTGTLKTSMCVRASQGFPQMCEELGVRYSQCGSLMVSFGEIGTKVLQKKLESGIENGVRGLKILAREEVLTLEPNLAPSLRAALYVPETGTVMPWELCIAAAENAAANGVDILLNTSVTDILHMENGGFTIQTNTGTYSSRCIINCAGMESGRVYEMLEDPIVQIVPTGGDYIVLDTKAARYIKHIIFHESEEKGKGLTLVPTVDGNILIGPTERLGDDFATSGEGLEELNALVDQVIPALPMEHIIRSFGAVRPNPFLAVDKSASVSDFCILESCGGAFVSLIGVKTPGLTCANELGSHAADKIASHLDAKTNRNYEPRRQPIIRLNEMSFEKRASYVQSNDPRFGRIICRCRGISEGEVINAIRANPGATTLDGIKRRTGTGSGRCQGGFCSQRIVELLAIELNRAPEEITKDGEGSCFLRGILPAQP